MPFRTTCFLIAFSFVLIGHHLVNAESDEEAQRREIHQYLKGRYLFQKQCTICHGATGRGDGPWAAELSDKPRNFRTGVFKFRTTPFGTLPTEDDLRRTIRSGISGTAMPFFKDFSDDDVDALVVFIQSMSRNWKKDELRAEPLDLPAVPGWFHDIEATRRHNERGAETFAMHCAVCHGSKGDGDGPGAVGLVDIWEEVSKPAQLSAAHHKSGDAPADLYRSIATGLNGTPMIGYVELLEEGDIWNLVSFIQSLSKTDEVTRK
ncbi:MAG: cytochrome c [Verrucomicrobiales bacterium]|nr:cytochrome c [Verrucomicrobiales bacterium]